MTYYITEGETSGCGVKHAAAINVIPSLIAQSVSNCQPQSTFLTADFLRFDTKA